MFPSGLVWDGEKFGTAITIPAFSWLRAIPEEESSMTSPTGFGADSDVRRTSLQTGIRRWTTNFTRAAREIGVPEGFEPECIPFSGEIVRSHQPDRSDATCQ